MNRFDYMKEFALVGDRSSLGYRCYYVYTASSCSQGEWHTEMKLFNYLDPDSLEAAVTKGWEGLSKELEALPEGTFVAPARTIPEEYKPLLKWWKE